MVEFIVQHWQEIVIGVLIAVILILIETMKNYEKEMEHFKIERCTVEMENRILQSDIKYMNALLRLNNIHGDDKTEYVCFTTTATKTADITIKEPE
jgi:hypothetical protein